jgi:predicted AAA+ superfamily ATPase
MDAVFSTMEADEATANTSPVGQDTAPTAGSKCVISAGCETKLKVPKKVLTKEEKLVQTKKRWDRSANARPRETQQAIDAATRVAASIVLDMEAKANAHVRLVTVVVEAMLLTKQEGISNHAPPSSSVSSVSFQLARPHLRRACIINFSTDNALPRYAGHTLSRSTQASHRLLDLTMGFLPQIWI